MWVRPFTEADAPGWVALGNLVFDRKNTLESFHAQEARRRPGELMRRWVVAPEGEMIGLATLFSFPFDPPGHLHASLGVHPGRRLQGLGQRLAQMVLEAAREVAALGLVTDVSDTDPQSVAWAERRGFRLHAHRFASELDLGRFDETPHRAALERAQAQGVRFMDLGGADGATIERYLDFVADRLTETTDLAGHPRWSRDEVWTLLHLDSDARLHWFIVALGPGGEWLGTTAMIEFPHLNMAYNELTATHPQARGRGLALPLKLHAIRRAKAAGLPLMRTNNHSLNAPMLTVNRRLGFVDRPGRYELHRPL